MTLNKDHSTLKHSQLLKQKKIKKHNNKSSQYKLIEEKNNKNSFRILFKFLIKQMFLLILLKITIKCKKYIKLTKLFSILII